MLVSLEIMLYYLIAPGSEFGLLSEMLSSENKSRTSQALLIIYGKYCK